MVQQEVYCATGSEGELMFEWVGRSRVAQEEGLLSLRRSLSLRSKESEITAAVKQPQP